MTATTKVQEFYGLVDRETGELVRLDANYISDEYPALSDDLSKPVFRCPDEESLAMALFEDTPHYNANDKTPSWGRMRREQLQPVKVRITQETEEFVLREPLSVDTYSIRDIPYSVARNYAGGEFEHGTEPRVAFWLAVLPENVQLADAVAMEGTGVFGGDRYSRRTLYKALPVPEDYADLLEGRNGVLLLASSSYG